MNLARLYFGFLLLTLGVILALGQTEALDAGEMIGTWWPVAVIVAGGLSFAVNPRHWLTPLAIVGVGVVVLLSTTEAVDVDALPMAWAILLAVAGAAVLAQALLGGARVPETGDRVRAFAAFGGNKMVSHSRHFEGGSLGALFGGTELDLRDAVLAPDASLDVFTAFGGTEIRVPEGWRVQTHGLPLFGAFENAAEGGDEGDPVLDVNATVLFGALEVKH